MPKSNFVMTKKAPAASKTYNSVRTEIRKDLGVVGKRGEASYRRVVADWSEKSRPDFKSRGESGPKITRLTIRAIGTKFQLFIWKMINKTGRKAKKIFPKPSNKLGLLFFQWGGPGSYQAKTRPNPARFGGPGTVANGRLTVAKSADHKGFPPRRFDKALNPEIEEEALDAIRRAGRRGLQRVKKG